MKWISNIKLNKQNRAAEVLLILSIWACDFASFMLNKLYKMLKTNIIPHAILIYRNVNHYNCK